MIFIIFKKEKKCKWRLFHAYTSGHFLMLRLERGREGDRLGNQNENVRIC